MWCINMASFLALYNLWIEIFYYLISKMFDKTNKTGERASNPIF